MSKKDKYKLLVLGAFIGMIALAILFYKGSRILPWYIVISVVLLAEFVYFAPRVCSNYYKLNKITIGFSKWVPLYNELRMMNSSWVNATVITFGVTCVLCALRFVPNSVIGKIFGFRAGMFWGYNIMPFIIIALVVLNIVFGLGLCAVFRNINSMIYEHLHTQSSRLEGIYYFLLLLPLVRICALATMLDKTQILLRTGYGYQDEQIFIKQED